MAIVPMSKINIVAMKEDERTILKFLSILKVTQIDNITKEELSVDYNKLLEKGEYREELAAISEQMKLTKRAIDTLARYQTTKKAMFSSRRVLNQHELNENIRNFSKKMAFCTSVNEIKDARIGLRAEKNRYENEIEALSVWKELPFDTQYTGTNHVSVMHGSVNAMVDIGALEESLNQKQVAYCIGKVHEDRENIYIYIVYHNQYAEDVMEVLREVSFSGSNFHGLEGSVKDIIADYEKKIEINNQERQALKARYKDFCKDNVVLEELYDVLTYKHNQTQAMAKAAISEKIFMIKGFVPTDSAPNVKLLVEREAMAVITIESPGEEEFPILLKNSKLVQPFEVITSMYSLPSSKGIDPNTVMSIFYFVFFGMMVSDAAYGIISAALCGFIWFKFKPEGQMGQMIKLIGLGGISTMLWGALFGSWFGDVIPMLTGGRFDMPKWFSPIDDPMKLLVLSFILGGIHLLVALGVKAYMLIKNGKLKDAICDIGSWYFILIGAGLLFVGGAVGKAAVVILCVGVLMLILTQGRQEKNVFLRLFKGIASLYDVTGYLSDILSYSRLLALGLATGVIASVVNTMGLIGGNSFIGWILFVAVFIFGHVFNMAINFLGAYVHTSRLQYVEFFGKFYESGGKEFIPITADGKYTKIEIKNK